MRERERETPRSRSFSGIIDDDAPVPCNFPVTSSSPALPAISFMNNLRGLLPILLRLSISISVCRDIWLLFSIVSRIHILLILISLPSSHSLLGGPRRREHVRLGRRPGIKSFVICRSTNESLNLSYTFRGVDSWVMSPCQRQASPHSWDSPSWSRALRFTRVNSRSILVPTTYSSTLIFLTDNSLWHC